MKDLLIQGETIEFENDDSSGPIMSVFYIDGGGKRSWATGFVIEFNAKIVATFKSFAAFEKHVQEFANKYNLKKVDQ